MTLVSTQTFVFLLTSAVLLFSALSPVHPAAFPAALAGDPLWREDNEKRSVLQVSLQISFVSPTLIKSITIPVVGLVGIFSGSRPTLRSKLRITRRKVSMRMTMFSWRRLV